MNAGRDSGQELTGKKSFSVINSGGGPRGNLSGIFTNSFSVINSGEGHSDTCTDPFTVMN